MSNTPFTKRYFGTAFFVFLRRNLLYPLGVLWACAAFIKNWLYNNRVWESYRSTLPTIAIGNLSMGGTGKTPLVLYICSLLNPARCAVISRGYGRETKGLFRILPGGDPKNAGDEPQLMANRMPQATVVVSEDRVEALRLLESVEKQVQVAVLDDAFQHRKVEAGLYLLTCSWHAPFWLDRPFPAGHLREWPSGAKRAHALILTQTPQGFPHLSIPESILKLNLPTYYLRHRLAAKAKNQFGQEMELSALNKHYNSLIAFCGLGRPQAFEQSLHEAGVAVLMVPFRDHHVYSREDAIILSQKAGAHGALITTEKDAVKLNQEGFFDILPSQIPLWTVQLELEWESQEIQQSFHQQIHHYVATHSGNR